jgi:chlorophyllide a hydrolase
MRLSPPLAIYIYWALGLTVGLVFFPRALVSPNWRYEGRRLTLLSVSLALLAVNAAVYSKSVFDGGRTIDLASVLIFSLGNGIAETIWFYAAFSFGRDLAERFAAGRHVQFVAGLLTFMLYSGLIHGLFWMTVLPEHIAIASEFRPFLMPVLLAITLSWALWFYWYRDLHTVMVLHALIDITMICNVKFSMFF